MRISRAIKKKFATADRKAGNQIYIDREQYERLKQTVDDRNRQRINGKQHYGKTHGIEGFRLYENNVISCPGNKPDSW